MKKRDSLHEVLLVFVILSFLLIQADYLIYNNFLDNIKFNQITYTIFEILFKINERGSWTIRLVYILLLSCMLYLKPSFTFTGKNKQNKYYFVYSALITSALVIYGFWDLTIYDVLFFQILFFLNMYLLSKALSFYTNKNIEEDFLGSVSCKVSKFCFYFKTDKGTLSVHSPQQNIWIDGGPGSGKSQSLIKPIIKQAAFNNVAGLIYDFEGDPREPGSPLLGRIAYTAVMEARSKGSNLKFSFLNFCDPLKSVRVNILTKKYLKTGLDLRDCITNLMSNLSVNKDKSDFWEKYGSAYVLGIATKLLASDNKCNLPLVIAIALNPISEVLEWAKDCQNTRMIMAPIFSAYNNNATSQLAGAETSGQLPLSALLDPVLFWVLSEDEFNLDITNKENPYLFCVGNSKKLQQAVAPAISTIITIVMKNMNAPGKNESIFVFDEFPTVKVNGIDIFIATARKHKVSTILALQDFDQAVRDYNDKSANILRASCGSQFFGSTGNLKTAEFVSNSLGDKRTEQTSYNVSYDSNSQSISMQKDKVLQARDILSQPVGHFTGKIAGGKPAWFSAQFEDFKYEDQEIPRFGTLYDKLKDKKIPENLMDQVADAIIVENYQSIICHAKDLLNK
jgi:hypothetical protein